MTAIIGQTVGRPGQENKYVIRNLLVHENETCIGLQLKIIMCPYAMGFQSQNVRRYRATEKN
jgi:hypothetical protein